MSMHRNGETATYTEPSTTRLRCHEGLGAGCLLRQEAGDGEFRGWGARSLSRGPLEYTVRGDTHMTAVG